MAIILSSYRHKSSISYMSDNVVYKKIEFYPDKVFYILSEINGCLSDLPILSLYAFL